MSALDGHCSEFFVTITLIEVRHFRDLHRHRLVIFGGRRLDWFLIFLDGIKELAESFPLNFYFLLYFVLALLKLTNFLLQQNIVLQTGSKLHSYMLSNYDSFLCYTLTPKLAYLR